MLNKYQKALDNFKGYKNICEHMKFDEDIATLQELVDNYSKLLKALDKACEWITDNDGWVNIYGDEDWISRFPNGIKTKEEWKEWLLRNEQ